MRTILAVLSGFAFLCLSARPARAQTCCGAFYQGPIIQCNSNYYAVAVSACNGAPQAAKTEHGAQAEPPPEWALGLRSTTAFTAPAPIAYMSEARCDSHGNIFFQPMILSGSPMITTVPPSVVELIPDEKRVLTYSLPPLDESRYPHATTDSFAVNSYGTLYSLVSTLRISPKGKPLAGPEYYVLRFKDDGTMDSITHIQAPPGVAHWYANLLAAFPGGGFLITGTSTTTKERPGAGDWRPFTAVYGPAGRFVSEVRLPEDVTNNWVEGGAGKTGPAAKPGASPAPASNPQQYFEAQITTGGLVSGPDGNVWIMRNSDPIRLYAVDSTGQVVEHFEFSPPVPGMTPFDFGLASPEEVFLEFIGPPGGPRMPSSGPAQIVAVFNTSLRQYEALYTSSAKAKTAIGTTIGNLACSDGRGGFLYLGTTDNGYMSVSDYTPH